MAKGGKSSGDYEGWILRLIKGIEDLRFALSEKSWLDFAASMIEPGQGYALTGSQKAALRENRVLAFDVVEELGAKYTPIISRTTGKPIRGDSGVRFRDVKGLFGQKGAFISKANLDIMLRDVRTKPTFRVGREAEAVTVYEHRPNILGGKGFRYRDTTGQFGRKGAYVSAAKIKQYVHEKRVARAI